MKLSLSCLFKLPILILSFLLAFQTTVTAQTTYYVDVNSTQSSGTLANPFITIHEAIAVATSGFDTILVTADTLNQYSYLGIVYDIVLKGGYDSSFNNQIGYTTIRNIGISRLIKNVGLTNASLFDRLIILDGISYNESGGGVYNISSSPRFTNMIIENCYSRESGGGMYNYNSTSTFTNVKFINNKVDQVGAGLNCALSDIVLTNVFFINNYAKFWGGGYYNSVSNVTMNNVQFYKNSGSLGGGMYNYAGDCNLNNVSFIRNDGRVAIGAIYNADDTAKQIINNSLFFENTDKGIYPSDLGSIFVMQPIDIDSTSTNNASDWTGLGISLGNGFIDLSNYSFSDLFEDYDFDGIDDIWGTIDDGFYLKASSPLVNAGNNTVNYLTTDICNQTRVYDSIIDIGAYEFARNTLYVSATSGSNSNPGTINLPLATIEHALSLALLNDIIYITAETYNLSSTLYINKDVVIKGGFNSIFSSQDSYTIINGGHIPLLINGLQIFNLDSLTSNTLLENLIIRNGYDINGEGGGMRNNNSSVYLKNIIFKNNKSSDKGGGLYNFKSNPILKDVYFIDNIASKGGGVYNNNSMSIMSNIAFDGNSANQGGANYELYSQTKMTNAVFIENQADYGGAIYNKFSKSNYTNTSFVNNIAFFNGAGFYIDSVNQTNPEIYNSVFYGNMVNNAISDIETANTTTTLSTNSSNNASDGNGGGISSINSSSFIDLSLNIFPDIFTSNDYDGVDNILGNSDDGLIPLLNSPIFDAADSLYNDLSYDFKNSYRNCYNSIDIGAYERDRTKLYVSINGSDSNNGSINSPLASIDYALIVANMHDTIYITSDTYYIGATLDIREDMVIKGGYNNSFTNQDSYTTIDADGKQAIHTVLLTNDASFDHLLIKNAYSDSYGGGLFNENSDLVVSNVIFKDNSTNHGGGAVLNDQSTPIFINVIFENNSANYGSGAVLNSKSNAIFYNVIFVENESSSSEAAVGNNYSDAQFINTSFVNNIAAQRGGAMYNYFSSPLIQNSVFYGNIADFQLAGVETTINGVNSLDSLSMNNAADTSTGGLDVFNTSTYVDLSAFIYSDVFSDIDYDGIDDIYGTADDGLVPASLSPLLDTGNNTLNLLSFDFANQNRVFNSIIDIGAYEYNQYHPGFQEYEEKSLYIYPNPTNNNVYLVSEDATKVEIYNLSGKKIEIISINSDIQVIDLSNYPSDMYLFRVMNGNTVLGTQKIIKK